ncbi:allantoicase-like [Bombyx mandarina]|uniref:Allantoate amidinohydrolase n=1 Tax=Bombyx mandarina TaxID=7092 RepID=A0A6J2KUV1_BOMMA|nr:allantoicase-like [Bombyx mandarina]
MISQSAIALCYCRQLCPLLKMLIHPPSYTSLSELASHSAGGKVLFATDDFFATCENMIADEEPIFIADKYTEYGKWMDGWETRRKRIPGHDWCIIKLATKCVIKGLVIDTAFFTGNNAPKFSIQAATLTSEDEKLIPVRHPTMGSSCSAQDMELITRIHSDEWQEIVPVTVLRPGYEDTRFNYQKVVNDDSWTHIRVNIYPDGGIARLRVFGEAKPELLAIHDMIDLVSLLNGGICQGFSNAHYGHPRNILKPMKSRSMADGWETARRADRPEIIEENDDGTLRFSGNEWAVYKLGFAGTIRRVCIDTTHFKGNYPDHIRIEGCNLGQNDWDNQSNNECNWRSILVPCKLSAHKEHWFSCQSDLITHVRVTIAPDGGLSRLRLLGYVDQTTL